MDDFGISTIISEGADLFSSVYSLFSDHQTETLLHQIQSTLNTIVQQNSQIQATLFSLVIAVSTILNTLSSLAVYPDITTINNNINYYTTDYYPLCNPNGGSNPSNEQCAAQIAAWGGVDSALLGATEDLVNNFVGATDVESYISAFYSQAINEKNSGAVAQQGTLALLGTEINSIISAYSIVAFARESLYQTGYQIVDQAQSDVRRVVEWAREELIGLWTQGLTQKYKNFHPPPLPPALTTAISMNGTIVIVSWYNGQLLSYLNTPASASWGPTQTIDNIAQPNSVLIFWDEEWGVYRLIVGTSSSILTWWMQTDGTFTWRNYVAISGSYDSISCSGGPTFGLCIARNTATQALTMFGLGNGIGQFAAPSAPVTFTAPNPSLQLVYSNDEYYLIGVVGINLGFWQLSVGFFEWTITPVIYSYDIAAGWDLTKMGTAAVQRQNAISPDWTITAAKSGPYQVTIAVLAPGYDYIFYVYIDLPNANTTTVITKVEVFSIGIAAYVQVNYYTMFPFVYFTQSVTYTFYASDPQLTFFSEYAMPSNSTGVLNTPFTLWKAWDDDPGNTVNNFLFAPFYDGLPSDGTGGIPALYCMNLGTLGSKGGNFETTRLGSAVVLGIPTEKYATMPHVTMDPNQE